MIEVLRAVVVVERARVEQHLPADAALVRLSLVHGPDVGAQLVPHESKDGLVREPVVAAQVDGVAALEGAIRAVEGAPGGDLLQHHVTKVA